MAVTMTMGTSRLTRASCECGSGALLLLPLRRPLWVDAVEKGLAIIGEQ